MQKYEKNRALSPIDKKLGSSLKKSTLLKPGAGGRIQQPEKTTSYYSLGRMANPLTDDYSSSFYKMGGNRESGSVEMKGH